MQILVLIGLYFLKCTKFDHLILRKIIKIVATRCQILTLKCTKIDFGWGSDRPDPVGVYPLADPGRPFWAGGQPLPFPPPFPLPYPSSTFKPKIVGVRCDPHSPSRPSPSPIPFIPFYLSLPSLPPLSPRCTFSQNFSNLDCINLIVL